jgi:hypothetical protein
LARGLETDLSDLDAKKSVELLLENQAKNNGQIWQVKLVLASRFFLVEQILFLVMFFY